MEQTFANPAFERSEPGAKRRLSLRGSAPASIAPLELVTRVHAQRTSLESFIKGRFDRSYGASLTHFCVNLLGIRDAHGAWRAGVGYTIADAQPLFLEQYLDAPIETVLERATGCVIARERVVEVGNLAAATSGAARSLIGPLARYFHDEGCRWAVFTATREVRNAFARLRTPPLVLGHADPKQLRDGSAAWGRYYAHDPVVMGGSIESALRLAVTRVEIRRG